VLLLLTLACLAGVTCGKECLPGQRVCGDTCCSSADTCCTDNQGRSGCAPPGGTCCASSTHGFCTAKEACCSIQQGWMNGTSTCCSASSSQCCHPVYPQPTGPWCADHDRECWWGGGAGNVCASGLECCPVTQTGGNWSSSCYDNQKLSCCAGGSTVTSALCKRSATGGSGCCMDKFGGPACVDDVIQKCCPAGSASNNTFVCTMNATCCPSPTRSGATWSIPDTCCTGNQVCCTTAAGSRVPRMARRAASLRATPLTCADPAKQFCCTFAYHDASVSEACALGTLCCPGNGGDGAGSGCCLGFNGTSYKCRDDGGCPLSE